jgi:hypothetical protein
MVLVITHQCAAYETISAGDQYLFNNLFAHKKS